MKKSSIEVIKEGMIGFSASKSFISKVIRWFTKSKWSHCFVVWKVLPEFKKFGDYRYILIIEAGEFTVQIVPFKKYLSKGYEFILIDIGEFVTDDLKSVALEKLLDKVENLYGWLQLIGFGIVILLRKWFGYKRRHNIFGYGKICSEVVAEYLIDCGFSKKDVCGDKDINLVSPEDIFKFLISLDRSKIIMKSE